MSLFEFVQLAWKVLEPATTLQENWHLHLISDYLTLIANDKFREKFDKKEGIIFNVPPRTMKSLLITVFFPAWVWTMHPEKRFMFASYSEKLATQHSVYRRAVIESDFYQHKWGEIFKLSKDQNAKHHYENSARGCMFSTGMQSTATGLGGDILIFDDPLNPEQALSDAEREAVNLRFDSTFRSRINNPATGIKIVIMQRLHERDLTGHILAREPSRWERVSLPAIAEEQRTYNFPSRTAESAPRPKSSAKREQSELPSEMAVQPGELLWPERLSREFLDSQKIGMGSWAFAGQYQQNPAPLEGGIIRRNWVRFYRDMPDKFDLLVQSWDCTFTGGDHSDYVAGQVWGRVGSNYYMLPYRMFDRLDFAPTKAAIKSCAAMFPHANYVLIEDKANGPAIISELQKEISAVIPISPEGGKISRAQAMAPLWEAGNVHLPDPQVLEAPWMENYIHNLCTFPRAAHDDDVDSTSQALIFMRNRLRASVGLAEFYKKEAAAAVG